METITIIDSDSNQFICRDVGSLEGFEYPTTRLSIEDLAGDRSAVYVASKAGRRPLSWQGLLDTDFMEKRRDLQLVLRPDSVKTIKFTTCDGLALQAEVAIEKLLMPYRAGRSMYLIEAVSADWRFYSQTLHEFETGQTVITGGFGIPAEIPLDMSGGSYVLDNDILNAGTDTSYPTFTITGPGSTFTIGNQTTGGEMVITYTLTASDTIVIDVISRTIVLNGITNIYSSLTTGDFWGLQPGANTIRFVVVGLGVETLLNLVYRDAYMGI